MGTLIFRDNLNLEADFWLDKKNEKIQRLLI